MLDVVRDSPPFEPGQTFYGGRTPVSADTGCEAWEGRVFVFEDLDYSVQGTKPHRTNKPVYRMIVRNKGSVTLAAKRLARMRLASGLNLLGHVAEMGYQTGDHAFPVDEFLSSTGLRVHDWGYIVIGGPALTKLRASDPPDTAVGDILTADTTAASTGDDSGKVAPASWAITSQATDLSLVAKQLYNFLGRALSVATTGNDGADLLIHVGKW